MYLDKDQAINLMEKAIGEMGADHVYKPFPQMNELFNREEEVCLYFSPEGQPSCIVGHVFSYLGYGPNILIEGKTASAAIDTLGIDADPDAVAILEATQSAQDIGKAWGVALADAKDSV